MYITPNNNKFDKKRIWIVSDLHIDHRNISRENESSWDSGYRDFNSTHEMNLNILDSVNSKVKENDLLINVGDFSFGKQDPLYWRNQIQCKEIIHIYGNHDHKIKEKQVFEHQMDYLEFYIDKKLFVFFHYPILNWNGKHNKNPSIMCHGHTHLETYGIKNLINVCWCIHRSPILIESLIDGN